MMSRISFDRKKVWIRKQFGVRARLILFALIIAAPLMVERIHALQSERKDQTDRARKEFALIPRQLKAAQKEILLTISAILKPASYTYAALGERRGSCDAWKTTLAEDLPWISNIQAVDHNGYIRCSTHARGPLEPINIGAHSYFAKALNQPGVIASDYVFFGPASTPMLRVAYSSAPITNMTPIVILASINMEWLSNLLNGLSEMKGVRPLLIDNAGTILAAPTQLRQLVGETMPYPEVLHAIQRHSALTGQASGDLSVTTSQGVPLAVTYTETQAKGVRLVASIDTDTFSKDADSKILTAYLHLTLILLVILFGAIVAADQLIMRPINHLRRIATEFGQGRWSTPTASYRLPIEFHPLARALYGMAARLRGREAQLRASNDHLALIAVIDPLSGLANRRGLQNQLDLEWDTAWRTGGELSLLMIDVDHFKLYNDHHGHLRGDDCLAAIGRGLADVVQRMGGFAARYGGEEFCILLPGANLVEAARMAETARRTIADLAIPHPASDHHIVSISVGFASTRPHGSQGSYELIERADAALYAAKRNGRNMVLPNGPMLEAVTGPGGRDRRAPPSGVTALNH